MWRRWIPFLLGAVAVIWLIWVGRAIWFPVSIAFVIAMVLDPTVDRLENRGCSRALATTLVFLTFVGIVTLCVVLLSPTISTQAGKMADYLRKLVGKNIGMVLVTDVPHVQGMDRSNLVFKVLEVRDEIVLLKSEKGGRTLAVAIHRIVSVTPQA